MYTNHFIYDGFYGEGHAKHEKLLKDALIRRTLKAANYRKAFTGRVVLHLGVRLIKIGRYLVHRYQHSIQF